MSWCEENHVDFVFGLARNARLDAEIAVTSAVETSGRATGKPARRFKDFRWATLDSWSRRRRVIGKAEWTQARPNPRFIVTSLGFAELRRPLLYENVYCARGEMENRIKECQLDLFADRTSTATMRANQLRLWFASMAYVLICALRRIGLAHTQFAEATCGTIRLKLLKIGALVRISADASSWRWHPPTLARPETPWPTCVSQPPADRLEVSALPRGEAATPDHDRNSPSPPMTALSP